MSREIENFITMSIIYIEVTKTLVRIWFLTWLNVKNAISGFSITPPNLCNYIICVVFQWLFVSNGWATCYRLDNNISKARTLYDLHDLNQMAFKNDSLRQSIRSDMNSNSLHCQLRNLHNLFFVKKLKA